MTTAIRNFFWFCAGVNRKLLLECESEFSKYFAIGATVFFTACFAAVSGAYALFFVFSGSSYAVWASIGFGILWGLTIFNIDRYLVISIKKENKPGKELLTALPRILLAIMIGVVIARPLELKIFDKEIKEGLKQYYLENQQTLNQTANSNFSIKHKNLYDQLAIKKADRDTAKADLTTAEKLRDAECYGKLLDSRTTGIFGDGPNCKLRKQEVAVKLSLYTTLVNEVSAIEKQISQLQQASGLNNSNALDDAALDSIVSNAGFYDRNKILGQISAWTPWSFLSGKKGEDESVAKVDTISTNNTNTVSPQKRLTIQRLDGESDKTVFFISMLIILIECLPIIVKLMSRRGSYDMKLDEDEDRIHFLTRHETYANKHLIQQLALSQREVLTKAIEQWEDNELKDENLGSKYVNPNDNQDNHE